MIASSGVTAPAPAELDAGRDPAMQEIAAAFLADLNGRRLQLEFDSLQPAIVDPIRERGRVGAYFTIGSGTIRAVP